jgi:hypothetical protein
MTILLLIVGRRSGDYGNSALNSTRGRNLMHCHRNPDFKNSAATAGIIGLAEKDRQPSDPKDRRM